jgi:hypothetical protein
MGCVYTVPQFPTFLKEINDIFDNNKNNKSSSVSSFILIAMSLVYELSFLNKKSIEKVNEQEKKRVSAMDISRLTSSWLHHITLYVALAKKTERDSSECSCFDIYRDHARVPTVNLQ